MLLALLWGYASPLSAANGRALAPPAASALPPLAPSPAPAAVRREYLEPVGFNPNHSITAQAFPVASAGTPLYPPGYDPQTGHRSYSQHAFTRIRPNSLLRADAPLPDPPDLRGTLERRRDSEMMKHYARMAQFDVLAEVAEKAHSVGLLEKIEEVRRKETQRFNDAMQDLRQQVWHHVASETP